MPEGIGYAKSTSKGNRATRKLKRSVKTKQAYAKYHDDFKKSHGPRSQPMTFANWKTGGRRQSYLGATGGTTATARLRRKKRKALGMKD